MRSSWSLAPLAALVAQLSCVPSTERASPMAAPVISDALHNGGTAGFFFLPPMVPRPASFGDNVWGVRPVVRIDEVNPDGTTRRSLASFTATSGPGRERLRTHERGRPCDDDDGDRDDDDYYYVRWFTDDARLSVSAQYRVRVFVPAAGGGQREVGFADVDVVRNEREFRSVDTQNFVPLVNGRVLRIKFRIESRAVDRDGDGAFDWTDNCPSTANRDQRDTDRDRVGDACECLNVTCAAGDACHAPGVCESATGRCTRPARPDGTTCALPHATAACQRGVCTLTACAAGHASCDGDLANGCETATDDIAHCGACGRSCPAADHATPVCTNGACGLACAPGHADCDGSAANGCERGTASDPANCGACGRACAAGQTCVAGTCTGEVCAPGAADCDGDAANGCEAALASDPRHCGACGAMCAFPEATALCRGGVCALEACLTGQGDCDGDPRNGCEVSLATDAAHCGGCGRACALAHASAACDAGACAVGACDAGWADCDGDAANGCEASLTTDVRACGACGNVCSVSRGVPACVDGACGVAACDAGWADCDGLPGNGCEADLGAATSCGACGRACPSGAHAAPTCAAGVCGLACEAGWGDCDGDAANGCEVDLTADAGHCGACATACANFTTCQGGACTTAVCAPGHADCNGLAGDGCEATPATDVGHCGACGRACSFAHAAAECVAGACGFAVCDAGYADCDGEAANGCEASLTADANHCGGCGLACAAGLSCLPTEDGGASCRCPLGQVLVGGVCVSTAGSCASGVGACARPGYLVAGTTGVSSGAAGLFHQCAVLQDGSVRCWGSNTRGQLGDGTTIDRRTPVVVEGLAQVVEVAAGYEHTCVRLVGGAVRCWGSNAAGELGDGTTVDRLVPAASDVTHAVALAATRGGTCAVLADGALRCWGGYRSAPPLSDVRSVAMGESHLCALRTDGTVWCLGSNSLGELGDGTTTARAAWTLVAGLSDVVEVDANYRRTCARQRDGVLFCWGDSTRRPVAVAGLAGVQEVALGWEHTCARLTDGTVRCWGDNTYGELGQGTVGGRSNTPVAVVGVADAIGITARYRTTCAALASGEHRCWGYNADGSVGDGTTTHRGTPVAVAMPPTSPFTCSARAAAPSVEVCNGVDDDCNGLVDDVSRSTCDACALPQESCSAGVGACARTGRPACGLFSVLRGGPGFSHQCAVLRDGSVRCWGSNASAQLGDGTTTDRVAPVEVVGIRDAVEVAGSSGHTCARLADGGVRCWGYNRVGQLGDGTTINRSTPVSAPFTDAVALAVGGESTCIVRSDRSLRCWGAAAGIPPLSDVRSVAVGDSHVCAVRTNGTVWCWGSNSRGELGDGTTTPRSAWTLVPALADVVAADAGYLNTCARLRDGTLRCWGENRFGMLNVTGVTGVVEVALGYQHTCARFEDGGVRCWGNNARGELGRGTVGGSGATPAPVVGVSDAVALSGRGETTCATLASGEHRCWGSNLTGAIGDGSFPTSLSRATPVTVPSLTRPGVICGSAPGAPAQEVCNGVDDDCDGLVDETCL